MSETKPIHPAAEIFPLMTGVEFEALVADIRGHGLREPIVLHGGAILDGRNRYRACEEAGVEPSFESWDQDGTPESYVVSKNLHRRHLNESQRAMIAARLANLRKGHVEMQRTTGLQIQRPAISVGEAAELLNVSPSTIHEAKIVVKEGSEDEIAAVESGEVAVSTVARQIRKGAPKEQRGSPRCALRLQKGKNPERIQKQQINAEIWGRVRDALTHLTSLPIPADVAAIVRAHDKTGLVDQRLSQSLTWLKEFESVWSNRSEDAA